jgi:hypothetical protein
VATYWLPGFMVGCAEVAAAPEVIVPLLSEKLPNKLPKSSITGGCGNLFGNLFEAGYLDRCATPSLPFLYCDSKEKPGRNSGANPKKVGNFWEGRRQNARRSKIGGPAPEDHGIAVSSSLPHPTRQARRWRQFWRSIRNVRNFGRADQKT